MTGRCSGSHSSSMGERRAPKPLSSACRKGVVGSEIQDFRVRSVVLLCEEDTICARSVLGSVEPFSRPLERFKPAWRQRRAEARPHALPSAHR